MRCGEKSPTASGVLFLPGATALVFAKGLASNLSDTLAWLAEKSFFDLSGRGGEESYDLHNANDPQLFHAAPELKKARADWS